MRKLALMAVLASTALAAPATARDNSWYVGVEGGAMKVQNFNFDVNGINNAGKVKASTDRKSVV